MKYRTIVADPPWEMDFGARTHSSAGGWANGSHDGIASPLPYDKMSVEQVAALPVSAMAERAAHLYLWTINAYIEDAYDIARCWGFRPSVLLTWCKSPMGLGYGGTFVQTTEHVLFCRRGVLPAARRIESTWFHWARSSEHSRKPDALQDIVEQISPGPYLELFARRQRLGWDTWGDEALCHVDLRATN